MKRTARPNQDENKPRRRLERHLATMAVRLEAETRRYGLSALDSRLGWAEGRLEEVLADPGELTLMEMEHLCLELDIRVVKLFDDEIPMTGNSNVVN